MNYEDKKIVAVLATNVEVATAFNVLLFQLVSILIKNLWEFQF